MNSTWFFQARLSCVLAVSIMLCGPRATAINIILDYEPQNNSENPSFDANGAKLTAIMQAAAAHWESIILDDHDLTVRYWYDNLDDGFLGQGGNLDSSSNRVNIGRIRFDTRDINNTLRNWYFDPTPTNDSEFAMQHQSYATDGNPAWFAGPPLGGVEIGYRGVASNGPASGNYDIYSTAVHEIGHLLGLINGLSAIDTEVLDGDFDIPPGLMNGHVSAVRTADPPPYNDVGEYAHIRPDTALMCDMCAAPSARRQSTAIDILAMASASDWTNIDLPRKMLAQGHDFNDTSGWLMGQAPGNFDDAFITIGGDFVSPIAMTADDSVGSLTVIRSYVSLEAHELFVNRTTTIAGLQLVPSRKKSPASMTSWSTIRFSWTPRSSRCWSTPSSSKFLMSS